MFPVNTLDLPAVQLPTRGPISKCLLQVQFLCAQQHLECGHRGAQGASGPHVAQDPKTNPVNIYQQSRRKLPRTRNTPQMKDVAQQRRTPKVRQYTCARRPGPASAEQRKELHSRVFCSGTSAGCCSASGKCVCSLAGAAVTAEVPGDAPR